MPEKPQESDALDGNEEEESDALEAAAEEAVQSRPGVPDMADQQAFGESNQAVHSQGAMESVLVSLRSFGLTIEQQLKDIYKDIKEPLETIFEHVDKFWIF